MKSIKQSHHHFFKKSSAGFTILEIIITSALITAIASLGITVGLDVYRSSTLSAERDVMVSALQKTRNFAMTNIGESDHGLYIENNKHTIFRGSSYEARSTDYDIEIINSSRFTSSGTLEFVFEAVSGDGLVTGTTSLTDERGVVRTISVNEEGGIDW